MTAKKTKAALKKMALPLALAPLLVSCAGVESAGPPASPQAWRGFHVLGSGASDLPALKRLIAGPLAAAKCNVLIYEIDYYFDFKSHPEIVGPDAWTKAQVKELVAAARAAGMAVIPEINCLGHQSWKEPHGPLLKAHPEFEEIPDGSTPQATLGANFYCRSWCPLHPQVHPYVSDLIDELVEAFGSKYFHAGMDETFVLASKQCPRCKGQSPAKLFAKAVSDLHARLKLKNVGMMIWADRLLDGKATGYGEWEASNQGTAPALDLIPKDVILCDWHYEGGVNGKFPSLEIFTKKGFRVWPTVYKNLVHAGTFMRQARSLKSPLMMGTLSSVWITAKQADLAYQGKGEAGHAAIMQTAIKVLERAHKNK